MAMVALGIVSINLIWYQFDLQKWHVKFCVREEPLILMFYQEKLFWWNATQASDFPLNSVIISDLTLQDIGGHYVFMDRVMSVWISF